MKSTSGPVFFMCVTRTLNKLATCFPLRRFPWSLWPRPVGRRFGLLSQFFLSALVAGFAAFTSVAQAQVSPVKKSADDDRTPNAAIPKQHLVSHGSDQSTIVYAVGKATIYQGDLASARKIALQAAYAEAVAQGTGLEVGSLTLIKNVSQVTDLVTSQSRGIVRRYEVVQEDISLDGIVLTLGIKATVEARQEATEESRKDALQLLLGILGNPQVLVLIPQYDTLVARGKPSIGAHITDPGYIKSADASLHAGVLQGTEAAFSQSLADAGYRTATPDMVLGRVDAALLSRARNGGTLAAIEIAREIGADIVLIGSLKASTRRISPQGVEFESVSAEFAARALVTATGRGVETFFESATVAHVNRLAAISQIKKLLAEQMAARLAWRIPKILGSSPNVLRLEISGLDGKESLDLQKMLRRALEIESVELLRLPDQSGTVAEFELRTGFVRISPSQLFALLNSYFNKPVSIVKNSPFLLKLKIRV